MTSTADGTLWCSLAEDIHHVSVVLSIALSLVRVTHLVLIHGHQPL